VDLRRQPDRGAAAVEYGIVVVLIAAVVVTAVTTFGLAVQGLFAVPGAL
jgi:Flp pilus assembly pilin Flp